MNSEIPKNEKGLGSASHPEPQRGDPFDLCLWAGLLGALLLVSMICFSPNRLIYDESHPLVTLSAAEKHGWKQAFKETISASGPLEPFVQGTLKPITGLKPVPMRIINLAFCGGLLWLLFRIARTMRLPHAEIYAFAPLCLPPFWPPAGMALTEMPFLFFLFSSCLVVVAYLGSNEACSAGKAARYGCLAGLLLGVACLGRQIGLVAVGGLLVASVARKQDRLFALAAIVALLVAAGWLFLMWGGLVPPSVASIHTGSLRFNLAALGLGYLGVISLIAAPRFLMESSRWALTMTGVVFVLCSFKPLAEFFPAKGIAERFFPSSLWPLYQSLSGAFMTGFAFLVLWRLVQLLWEERTNRVTLFLAVTTVLFALSPIRIRTFSSRYVVPAGLLLLLLIWKRNSSAPWLAIRMVAGFFLGAGMLLSYYVT
jgi:hypothetical protein